MEGYTELTPLIPADDDPDEDAVSVDEVLMNFDEDTVSVD